MKINLNSSKLWNENIMNLDESVMLIIMYVLPADDFTWLSIYILFNAGDTNFNLSVSRTIFFHVLYTKEYNIRFFKSY